MNTVTVKFAKSLEHYDYLCPEPVQADSYVVVDSPHAGYVTAYVLKVTEGMSPKAKKRVVCVVDDRLYKKSLEDEKTREGIIARLREIESSVREEERLRYLAEKDPLAKELIAQLDKLAA